MSFEEHDDCFIWYCDQCNHFAAFKPHDFYACVAELKARGWSFTHHTLMKVAGTGRMLAQSIAGSLANC